MKILIRKQTAELVN